MESWRGENHRYLLYHGEYKPEWERCRPLIMGRFAGVGPKIGRDPLSQAPHENAGRSNHPDGFFWSSDFVLVNPLLSDRKRRIFAVACLNRHRAKLDDPRSLRALEVAERYADGLISEVDRLAAENHAFEAHAEVVQSRFDSRGYVSWSRQKEHLTRSAALLLSTGYYYAVDAADHIRRAVVNPETPGLEQEEAAHQTIILNDILGPYFASPPSGPSISTGRWGIEIHRLLDEIQQNAAFDLYPFLADALEEADCQDPLLLAHLRGPGPHFRGCWVIEHLGKT